MQILTHMREKVAFVQKRTLRLATEVQALHTDLGSRRDRLGKLKAQRDALRSTAQKKREASVYIDNPLLIDDLAQQRRLHDALVSDIEDLQVCSRAWCS